VLQLSAMGGKIGHKTRDKKKLLNKKKKISFSAPNNFKMSNKIKGNSINVTFFKSVISVWGSHYAYSSRAPENLATPLSLCCK